jgi:hypothetical protein
MAITISADITLIPFKHLMEFFSCFSEIKLLRFLRIEKHAIILTKSELSASVFSFVNSAAIKTTIVDATSILEF